MWFPDGVWEIIRSYMSIWKYPYDRVMLELPRYRYKSYSVYTSATKQVRFKKDIHYHHFIGKDTFVGGFFDPFGGIPPHPIITYELVTEDIYTLPALPASNRNDSESTNSSWLTDYEMSDSNISEGSDSSWPTEEEAFVASP